MAPASAKDWKHASSIYEFQAKDIDGNDVPLQIYKGQVVIIVNAACKGGNTPKSYTQLQAIYEKYASKGLRIACFPCNQFGREEPWEEPEIKKFVTDNFHVNFDMYSKIEVNGDGAHPLWKYLKHKKGGTLGDFIKWNFTKFLIDRNGQPIKRYAPVDAPYDWEDDIAKALSVPEEKGIMMIR